MLNIPNFGRNPDIPVTFEHKGKTYKGVFTEVVGAGGYCWHLMINRFYYGQMFWAEISEGRGQPVAVKDKKYGLRFYSQKGDLDYLANEFIDTVMLYYE